MVATASGRNSAFISILPLPGGTHHQRVFHVRFPGGSLEVCALLHQAKVVQVRNRMVYQGSKESSRRAKPVLQFQAPTSASICFTTRGMDFLHYATAITQPTPPPRTYPTASTPPPVQTLAEAPRLPRHPRWPVLSAPACAALHHKPALHREVAPA